jgi:hypothetical protein
MAGLPNKEEMGEEVEDKIFFSVCSKFLTGKNDVFVAIYDTNMEIDIAADAITIRRTKGCISFISPDLIIYFTSPSSYLKEVLKRV